MCGNPCCGSCLPAVWLQMNRSFSHSLLQFTKHSPGVMHSLQVSERGLKPQLSDTPLWLLSLPLPFTPVPYAPTEWLSKYQHAAREGDKNWAWGQAGICGEQTQSNELDWLCSNLESSLPNPSNFPVDTPLLSVQSPLSSYGMEWPSLGVEVLMMTV